jgi:hypothetical protein
MSILAALWPRWVHGLTLAVVAVLLAGAAVWTLRDIALPKERMIAVLSAVVLAIACLGLAVYAFLG